MIGVVLDQDLGLGEGGLVPVPETMSADDLIPGTGTTRNDPVLGTETTIEGDPVPGTETMIGGGPVPGTEIGGDPVLIPMTGGDLVPVPGVKKTHLLLKLLHTLRNTPAKDYSSTAVHVICSFP